MILQLIRKDFLLVKKYVMIMMLVAAIAPSFLLWNMKVEGGLKDFYGGAIFFIVLFVIVLFLSNSVSLVDETYRKGCAYLCTTPYSRNQIVLSKYAFSYIVFAAYCLIYWMMNVLLPEYTVKISFELIVLSLVLIAFFRCVLIPLEYRFGYEKAKYIITLLIIGMPFVISALFGSINLEEIDLTRFLHMDISLIIQIVGLLVVMNIISMVLSCYIFRKKDL